MSRKVMVSARTLADKDNLYSKSHSHHISLGRWKIDGTEELACLDKSCAPPPVGTGGSKSKGGVDKSAGYNDPQENVVGSPRARAIRDSYMGSGSRSEEDWDSIRANPDLRGRMFDAYNALPSYDKGAEKAYRDLAKEVEAQFDHLTKSGIKVEFVDYDPYTSATQMRTDVEAGSIRVMKTDVTGAHPFFTNEQNDKFRAVHDVFGHASTGRGFDRHGERSAYISHKEMFRSPDAVRALASETEGQNAVATLTGNFGEQKVALMPDDLVFDTRLASAAPQTRLVGMARVISRRALEFACYSAACAPPSAGGTGGSRKGGGGGGNTLINASKAVANRSGGGGAAGARAALSKIDAKSGDLKTAGRNFGTGGRSPVGDGPLRGNKPLPPADKPAGGAAKVTAKGVVVDGNLATGKIVKSGDGYKATMKGKDFQSSPLWARKTDRPQRQEEVLGKTRAEVARNVEAKIRGKQADKRAYNEPGSLERLNQLSGADFARATRYTNLGSEKIRATGATTAKKVTVGAGGAVKVNGKPNEMFTVQKTQGGYIIPGVTISPSSNRQKVFKTQAAAKVEIAKTVNAHVAANS